MASVKHPHYDSSREKLSQAYHLAGEAASDTAATLRARAKSSMQNGKQRAVDLEQKVETSIKAHPIISVGCAFAAGWLIAKLMK